MFLNSKAMKKNIPALLFMLLIAELSFAQFTINPNNAFRGQTLTVNMSDPNWQLISPSAPTSPYDIYFQGGANIYSTSFNIVNLTTLDADFTIPVNVPAGLYSVYVNYMWPWPSGPFNINGCDGSGFVFFDLNQNGVYNFGEPKVANKQIILQPGNHITYTNTNGNYSFMMPGGSYSVSYVPDTSWHITSSPAIYNFSSTSGNFINMNFGVVPNSPWYSVSTLVAWEAFPRCNIQRDITIVIHNNGTAVQNGTVQFTRASILTHISATPAPTTFVGNVYTWDYTNLQPNGYRTFVVRVLVPNSNFTPITNTAFTTARDLSGNVVDTFTYSLANTILCSYDPNDKVNFPTGEATPQHYTDINGELFYTIHFQNTGNDYAYTVDIYDTLDVSLDLNTLVFAGSSHPVETYLNPGRQLHFYFPNINLPDSNTSEINSHGFVSYRIRPVLGTPEFTVVNNEAYIVFDQNPAILTNNVFNTLVSFPTGNISVSGEEDISIFPNPVRDESVLQLSRKGKHSYRLEIYNAIGQRVKTVSLSTGTYMLKKKDFAPGIYLFRVKELNGSFIKAGKFVIE